MRGSSLQTFLDIFSEQLPQKGINDVFERTFRRRLRANSSYDAAVGGRLTQCVKTIWVHPPSLTYHRQLRRCRLWHKNIKRRIFALLSDLIKIFDPPLFNTMEPMIFFLHLKLPPPTSGVGQFNFCGPYKRRLTSSKSIPQSPREPRPKSHHRLDKRNGCEARPQWGDLVFAGWQMPILDYDDDRWKAATMVRAISNHDLLRFKVQGNPLNQKSFIAFMANLIDDERKKDFLVRKQSSSVLKQNGYAMHFRE